MDRGEDSDSDSEDTEDTFNEFGPATHTLSNHSSSTPAVTTSDDTPLKAWSDYAWTRLRDLAKVRLVLYTKSRISERAGSWFARLSLPERCL